MKRKTEAQRYSELVRRYRESHGLWPSAFDVWCAAQRQAKREQRGRKP